jgi:hypothetical protein
MRPSTGMIFLTLGQKYNNKSIHFICFAKSSMVNSLTPICLLAGTKNYPSVDFLRRNSTFFSRFGNTTTTHKQHHHGELFAPLAA